MWIQFPFGGVKFFHFLRSGNNTKGIGNNTKGGEQTVLEIGSLYLLRYMRDRYIGKLKNKRHNYVTIKKSSSTSGMDLSILLMAACICAE